MNRMIILVALVGGGMLTSSPASGQGFGPGTISPSYGYSPYQSYYPAYPLQVRPSAYAYGRTYTLPPVYPYSSFYGYPRTYVYPGTYRGPVVRRYRVTPNRSSSPLGPAHSSQYFGDPHASQYFGR